MDYEFYRKAIERSFFVTDKDGTSQPFILNEVQDKALKQLTGQDIFLKSRQQGVSTLFLAICTIAFISVENVKCVIIAHEAGVTQRLFDRVKGFLESLKHTFPGELPYTLKYNSRRELLNTKNGASFYIGTAGQRAFGHGDTINMLHVSEFSRYPEPEKMLAGLLQAVPKNGKVFIETTADGYNYFYRLWKKNYLESNPFQCHFIPWFATLEYSLPVDPGTEFMDSHPIYGDELGIMNTYHLAKEQMMWRRWKIDQLNGDIDKFNESYPATPDQAFILSGNNVWSNVMLSKYMLRVQKPIGRGNIIGYNPLSFVENEKGYISIWKEPEEFHSYTIGADVSEGKIVAEGDTEHETDYSCAYVIDRNTYEVVACWHGRIDPDQFGRQLESLGRYYNNALIAVERNAVGFTPLIVLRDLNYPNLYYREVYGLIADKRTAELGWVTDMHTKDLIINEATPLLRDGRITIYDEELIAEMMSYVRDERGRANAASGAHDDRVMAFLIAVKMLGQPMPAFRGNPIERRDGEMDGDLFWMGGVSFNKQGQPVDPEAFTGDASEGFEF